MGGFVGEDVDGPRVEGHRHDRHNDDNDDDDNDDNNNNNNNKNESSSNNNNSKDPPTPQDNKISDGGGEEKGCVYCLDAHDGSIRWCCPLPGEVKSAPLFVHARRDTATATTITATTITADTKGKLTKMRT